MKAFEKWPEFMRSGSEAEEPASIDEAEDNFDIEGLTEETEPPVIRRSGASPRVLRAHARIQAEPGRGRRIATFALAGVTLCVLGVGVFFAYHWVFGRSSGEIPVVRAMDDPVKVKPTDPGGLAVPYQDQLVLNQPGSGGEQPAVERLLPPPEQPLFNPQPAQPAASGFGATSDTTAAAAQPFVPESSPTLGQGGFDGTTGSDGASFAQPQLNGAVVAPEVQARSVPAQQGNGPGIIEFANVETTQAAAVPTQGSYVLQLGSFNGPEVGQKAWTGFQNSYPDLLGGMTLFLQKAKVKGNTYHRVQAGPFPNRATAVDLCAQLKSRKQDCLVVKR